MKFDCKEISISDEPFGCTLTLSDEKDNGAEQMEMSIEQIMNSSEQYVLLQRSYPEDILKTIIITLKPLTLTNQEN